MGFNTTILKVITHIQNVCDNLKIGLSLCGKKAGPVLRLWWNPIVAAEPEKVGVDLKWSCWSIDKRLWDDRAPEVWEKMQNAFLGKGPPVCINTGPRKEIRYGSIVISKGKAAGYFCTEWDDVQSLADTLETECDDAFNEMIPYSIHTMEPGLDWEFRVKARLFHKLMEKIDNEENNLLEHDQREWGYIKNCFTKEKHGIPKVQTGK